MSVVNGVTFMLSADGGSEIFDHFSSTKTYLGPSFLSEDGTYYLYLLYHCCRLRPTECDMLYTPSFLVFSLPKLTAQSKKGVTGLH